MEEIAKSLLLRAASGRDSRIRLNISKTALNARSYVFGETDVESGNRLFSFYPSSSLRYLTLFTRANSSLLPTSSAYLNFPLHYLRDFRLRSKVGVINDRDPTRRLVSVLRTRENGNFRIRFPPAATFDRFCRLFLVFSDRVSSSVRFQWHPAFLVSAIFKTKDSSLGDNSSAWLISKVILPGTGERK